MFNSVGRRCRIERTSETLIAHRSSTSVNTAVRASRNRANSSATFAYTLVRANESMKHHHCATIFLSSSDALPVGLGNHISPAIAIPDAMECFIWTFLRDMTNKSGLSFPDVFHDG